MSNQNIEKKNQYNHIKKSQYEKRWVKFVAVCLFLLGIINIVSAWLSFDNYRLHFLKPLFEYEIIIGSRYLVIFTGIASLLIAPALYRQKRIAWIISVILLAVSGFAHVLKDADIEEASICILLLGILLPLYRYCNVKSDPVKFQHGSFLFAFTVIFIFLYTYIGIHLFTNQFAVDLSQFSYWKIALNSVMFNLPSLKPMTHAAKFFVDSLLVINSISFFLGLSFALSPVIARSLPEFNTEKYKKLVEKFAMQPVQFFTNTKDYQHYYHKDEESEGLISYKVSNRVALAIGNPCAKGNIRSMTEKWINYVIEHDWIPAVYQAQDDFLQILKEEGFNAVPIGVEAIINLETFSLEGKSKQSLRTAKNKATKEGWKIVPYEENHWEKIKKLDSKWLNTHGNSENSFAMGKSSSKYLSETRTMIMLDKDDNLLAYVNNVELAGINGRSIDLMRRDPEAPAGVMDTLLLHEILAAKEDNKAFYDLGFSPLAKIDEAFSDNQPIIKLFKLIFEKQRKYYDFQGLYQFKSKFGPEWKTSYLVYTNQLELPNILLALLRLNKG